MSHAQISTVTLEEAVTAIRSYNRGTYIKNGRPNLELDAEGYSLFGRGLGATEIDIENQVRWIGHEYGGSGNVLAGRELPRKIANDIFIIRSHYIGQLSSGSFIYDASSMRTQISLLYQPFQQEFRSPKGFVSRNWMVWATKFWHFLRPECFPIMDSRARQFFEVSASRDLIDLYFRFAHRVHETIRSRIDWLPMLRQVDGGHAQSDLKLWDKIAFELGGTDKSR